MVKKENEQDLVKLKKHWLRQNSLSPRSSQSDSTSKSTNSFNQIVDKRFRDRSGASKKDIDDTANDE